MFEINLVLKDPALSYDDDKQVTKGHRPQPRCLAQRLHTHWGLGKEAERITFNPEHSRIMKLIYIL